MKHYNEIAAVYDDQYAEEQKRKYEIVLHNIHILNGDCILDLGSGTGLFEAIGLECCVVGVDISTSMLMKATQRHCGHKISFLQADTSNLPFAEGVFDKIFSFTVLQNVPDVEKTMVEMRYVARKGSKVVLSVLKKGFARASFLGVLKRSGLSLVEFIDEEILKDYIVVCEVL